MTITNNSSTSFCWRSSCCRTDLSIHFQPSRPTTIWMFFLVTLKLSLVHSTMRQTTESVKWGSLVDTEVWYFFQTGTPASHRIRTKVSSMTCMLHRPERYHLHHRFSSMRLITKKLISPQALDLTTHLTNAKFYLWSATPSRKQTLVFHDWKQNRIW